ncbi:MAG: N-acetylneuraminate synthase family protein [Myxococcota bacterium]
MTQRHIELSDGRRIGDGHACFIIAEAGSNWRMGTPERDLAMARALVDVAVEAKCDAVKFQTYRANSVYVANAGESDYLAEMGVRKSITEIFEDLSMPYELIPAIAEYCVEQGIRFMSTPFSLEDVAAVDPYTDFHKIASYEISHTELQDHLASLGKPLVFSTGASTLDDIDYAMQRLRTGGAQSIAVMQCTARYPTPFAHAHVRTVTTLKERYGVPVGLSDHTRHPTVAPSAAVALGANLIEKHYTLSNRLPGADHPFALEPHELKAMVEAIRQTEEVMGSADKGVSEAEEELLAFARRGVQALRDLHEGDVVRLNENVAILRPGKRRPGAHPRHLDRLEGATLARSIAAGDGIHLDDVS